jgi:hypothetical protein
MHVEDAPPASGILSAHGHPMSGAVHSPLPKSFALAMASGSIEATCVSCL